MRLIYLVFFITFLHSTLSFLEARNSDLNDKTIVFICSANQVKKTFHSTSSCDLLRSCGGSVYSTSKTQAKMFGFMSCNICN